MIYLESVLGIKVTYIDSELSALPNYILSRYRLQKASLDGIKVIFAHPREELGTISAVKKHLSRIEENANENVVLVLDRITYRQKEYLLRERIPFVVEGKQIYLPFMAVYLQERCDSEKPVNEDTLPSSQLMLLYFIYHGCGELTTSEVGKALAFTATSISRACRQLESFGLIKTVKRGVQKIIYSDKEPQTLFESSRAYLLNPVKRTIYVSKAKMKEQLLASGYSALSDYSMLNPPNEERYAAASIAAWEKDASSKLENPDDECAVELWRYDPRKLAGVADTFKAGCVDRLSLALALKDGRDERVEEAVAEMLDGLWREINDKRN